ncbi:MAG: DUF4203 domain-containing protein [bacterium]|nr:DUF4203 domain-containing protein [bacterium]
MNIVVLVGTVIISIILCLFGIKLMRIGNALAAAVLGAGIGYYGAELAGMDVKTQMLLAIAGAVILGALAAIFKKFGAFLFCMIGVTGMLILLTRPGNWIFYAVYGGIGMLFAIAAMNWLDAVYIFATAFVGGVGIGTIIRKFIVTDNIGVVIAIFVIPVVMGCIVQFILKSREIGRKEAAHSEEVKKEISKEEEVESARALFGEEASDDVNREAESVDHVDETEETIE